MFEHELFKKFILVWASKADTDLPNCTTTNQMKDTLLLDGGENFLLSTAHDHDLLMTVYDVNKHQIGKKYIHDVDQIILINSGKAHINVHFEEPLH